MAIQGKKWNGKTCIETFNTDINCLSAVKTLHQTVVGLRTALDRSRSEINLLKSKVPTENIISKYSDAIEKLSLENHILRQKFLSTKRGKFYTKQVKSDVNFLVENKFPSMGDTKEDALQNDDKTMVDNKRRSVNVDNLEIVHESINIETTSPRLDNNDDNISTIKHNFSQQTKTDSEESEEVDNIELIFTTDDMKCINFQEELEPISDEGDTDDSKQEINRQSVLTQSVLVETDISKCGIVYDVDHSLLQPSKFSYQPILIKNRCELNKNLNIGLEGKSFDKVRPILNEKVSTVRDSEAQTDISALPPCWKSESYLVNSKTSNTFTTLPSKFAIPAKDNLLRKCSLKLCEKTKEARRILLSDINFTSMVPELSRSVDHLCQKGINETIVNNTPLDALKYLKSPLNLTSGSSQSRFDFATENSSWDCYNNSFSSDQNPSVQDLNIKRKQLSRPSVYSLDAYYSNRTSSVPPSPTQRRHSSTASYSSSHLCENNFSFPSPLQYKGIGTLREPISYIKAGVYSSQYKQKPKVTFKESQFSSCMQQSLPNVAVNHINEEDSTESLISESEECIRKSIDTVVCGQDNFSSFARTRYRTFSEPDLIKEFWPPLSAKPFFARSPHELLINYFVKVINTDGRVVAGKIKYVGILPGKTEYYVGVMLAAQLGDNDGSFQGHRFFTCEKNCGIFVPFRKVVMAWKV